MRRCSVGEGGKLGSELEGEVARSERCVKQGEENAQAWSKHGNRSASAWRELKVGSTILLLVSSRPFSFALVLPSQRIKKKGTEAFPR